MTDPRPPASVYDKVAIGFLVLLAIGAVLSVAMQEVTGPLAYLRTTVSMVAIVGLLLTMFLRSRDLKRRK
jgi:lysozyme family protein